MTPDEKAFDEELDIFRREVESGMQFFYACFGINGVANDKAIENTLNEAPLFWLTVIGALHPTFITLGRLFDQQSPHNVDTILRMAQQNATMFGKPALGQRETGTISTPPQWLDQYLRRPRGDC